MAKRLLNRRELRKASDEAELAKEKGSGTAAKAGVVKKAAKVKEPGAVKVKKPRKKKEPPRMCARWGIFDAAMKQVGLFDYSQKGAAQQKMADLAAKKNTTFFLQIVKEAMPEPVPTEVPETKAEPKAKKS